MPNTMLGWHWLAADRRLQYGTREVVEAGQTYRAAGPLFMCQNGMHAATRALNALQYAPGPIICRVRLGGTILHDAYKSVAETRTVLWMADATAILHEFALVCGHHALGIMAAVGDEPDPRSWAALDVKARWLRGEATHDELEAAREAARAAAREAAREATREAAWGSSRGAACQAAAREAAWGAALAAAWEAAWGSSRAAARLEAAREADRGAAREAENLILELLLESLR